MIHRLANVYDSTIGEETKIAAFAEVGGAIVGARCKIQAFAFICPGVELGDEVFVGPHVCFTNDRNPRAVGSWTPLPTRVGSGASIGAGAIILPGVTIGAGAVIAAGALVAKDVPPGETLIEERTKKMALPRDLAEQIRAAGEARGWMAAVWIWDGHNLRLTRSTHQFPIDEFETAVGQLQTSIAADLESREAARRRAEDAA